MAFLLTKYAITALVIVVVSELAKRSDRLGALVAALPLVTVTVMIWLQLEKQGSEKIASHAYYTFWYVLPTLPMFLLMPWLLHRGFDFWLALAAAIAVTVVSFAITVAIARRFGVELLP